MTTDTRPADRPAVGPDDRRHDGPATGPAPAAPGFRERFDSLLPEIQRHWPDVARQILEAIRGSFDDVAHVIAEQSGRTVTAVKQQLLELVDVAGDQTQRLGQTLQPLEQQLESLLDELNATLRPRIEKPVRERPLLAIGLAAGVGVLLGLLLGSGRRSA